MIVFTYSGQGSQQPGMGAAWREHPSWELVEEASEEAGRDLAHLLLDADADEMDVALPRELGSAVSHCRLPPEARPVSWCAFPTLH
jgi:[acyl-carrier-protein] S-malonyltransferase